MTLFVDTSVWSLALRRDTIPKEPEVQRLREAPGGGESIYTTGIVWQELLQGFQGPRAKAQIVERFGALAMIAPGRDDYIDAAELRNECRRHGIQIGTIDALLAQKGTCSALRLLSALRRSFWALASHWRASSTSADIDGFTLAHHGGNKRKR